MRYRNRSSPRRGAAAVEFALVAPMLILLLLGVLEVGRLVEVHQALTNAAREGGRQAAGGTPADQVQNRVRGYLRDAGLPSAAAQGVTVTLDSAAKTAQGDNAYKVVVTLPFKDVCWVPLYQVTGASTALRAEAVWARD